MPWARMPRVRLGVGQAEPERRVVNCSAYQKVPEGGRRRVAIPHPYLPGQVVSPEPALAVVGKQQSAPMASRLSRHPGDRRPGRAPGAQAQRASILRQTRVVRCDGIVEIDRPAGCISTMAPRSSLAAFFLTLVAVPFAARGAHRRKHDPALPRGCGHGRSASAATGPR